MLVGELVDHFDTVGHEYRQLLFRNKPVEDILRVRPHPYSNRRMIIWKSLEYGRDETGSEKSGVKFQIRQCEFLEWSDLILGDSLR